MKLSKWAKEQGLAYGTALKWFHNKTLPFPSEQLSSGTILVHPDKNVNNKNLKTIVYARVSSSNKKIDLENQTKLCEEFCIKNNWIIEKTYKEIASGMNDNRQKLSKILSDKNIRLVCLHKDRLTRFGFNYINKAIESNGGEIVVINKNNGEEEDLLKDFITIITSFCCRLYGARRGQSKALTLKESLKND
jgi:putative resolvase